MDPLVSLAAASIALVGTHFALSHPLRAPLVARIGERGFLGLYSLVALACIVWMARAFRAAPAADLGGATGEAGWVVASAVTLPALVLFLGSLRGNPAFPGSAVTGAPRGVFAVTRHPMMWGFALWAISHIVLWWSWRTTIVAIAILFLALVGAHLQDRKKAALLGPAWTDWAAQTSYWPRWSRLFEAGALLWLAALATWLLVTWMHIPAGGAPAGLWRWV
ncbi:NnrU family protein [Qipengyuania sediminis]|uniref:NnrU family protein n=1 Tax=Qipengyuania sediminis TaxID=1532023 RepID=UPI001F0F9B01|nr:NnrU family protein [Qipengyuania sediminis]